MADSVDVYDSMCQPPSKKIKVDNLDNNVYESVHSVLKDFGTFQQKRILSENGQRKSICIEGTFSDREGTAIVLLERKPFSEEVLKNTLTAESSVNKEFCNDIYGFYECFPKQQHNGIKVTVVHPATEKHIAKYISQEVHLVEETAELYKSITLPFLEKEKFSIQWVLNILEHKNEADRIIFEDPSPDIGFILVPDLKWDTKQIEDLYLVALVHQKGIKSLRDLNDRHLPLLRNIKEKGIKAIAEKFGILGSQLRIYVHYQPSFYHLHIHFTYLKYEAPGIRTEKSHLLSTIIENIELMSDYYQRVTLPFVIRETDNLFLKYEEKGILRRRKALNSLTKP